MRSPNNSRLNEVIDQLHKLEELGQMGCKEWEDLSHKYMELQDEIDNYGEYCSVVGVDD